MNDTYWKNYWEQHVNKISSDDPFQQVLRVQNKQPLSKALFTKVTDQIVTTLELDEEHTVLDICCGNGLLSAEIAQQCKLVIGIDFCEKLIEDINLRNSKNIIGIVSDVQTITFKSESFDRTLCAAALQHFSQAQVIQLFKKQANWLKPGGLLLVTDILDNQCIWNFYNNQERESVYFENVMKNTPVLGTWFDKDWLIKLAQHAGFSHAEIIVQPSEFLYAHYRFDLLCRK